MRIYHYWMYFFPGDLSKWRSSCFFLLFAFEPVLAPSGGSTLAYEEALAAPIVPTKSHREQAGFWGCQYKLQYSSSVQFLWQRKGVARAPISGWGGILLRADSLLRKN